MKSTLSYDLTKRIEEKIRLIAVVLCEMKEDDYSLMYGKTGIALFLFYYWRWKNQKLFHEKAKGLINSVFSELNKKIYLYKKNRYEPDLSFDSGLGGIGWGLNHLIKMGFIDCDLQETMCLVDAAIYRKMITGIHSDNGSSFKDALLISLYASDREDRLSKEYLRRFIHEFTELTTQENNEIFKKYYKDNNEMIAFINNKIRKKYPDIITEGFDSMDHAIFDDTSILKRTDNLINEKAELSINVGSGLASGIILRGYHANKKFRETSQSTYQKTVERCFDLLLKQKNRITPEDALGFWFTDSRGLWKIHYGLKNGLAGIGMALLNTITNDESTWDEFLVGCMG